jgi:chaperonin GroEL
MAKRVVFSEEARSGVQAGVDKLVDAVKVTMGARGRNVILSDGRVTKDGVSVARDIQLEDPTEQQGCKLIQQAANKTNYSAGDGTTAACVLAQALVHGANEKISKGKDAQILRGEILQASEVVQAVLLKAARAVDEGDIEKIASVSANDPEIGQIVADAIHKVGKDALVSIENSNTIDTFTEIVNGIRLDAGFVVPHFMTDPSKGESKYDDCVVLLYEDRLADAQRLVNIINPLHAAGKSIFIVADDFDGTIVKTLAVARVQNGLKINAVKIPSLNKEDWMDNLAVFTGATVIGGDGGLSLEDFKSEHLGTLRSVRSTAEDTTMECAMTKERQAAIKERADYLVARSKEFTGNKREDLRDLAARLSGKMAVIKVGGKVDAEIGELKDRIEDAVNATKAAMELGYVVGGGIAYLNTIGFINIETDGADVVVKALESPIRQIIANAGFNGKKGRGADKIVKTCLGTGDGFNALTGAVENLQDAGIIDPVKVSINALINATAAANLVLTTEAVITNE